MSASAANWPRLPDSLASAMSTRAVPGEPRFTGDSWLLTRHDDILGVLADPRSVPFVGSQGKGTTVVRASSSVRVNAAVRRRISHCTTQSDGAEAISVAAWLDVHRRVASGEECDLVAAVVHPVIGECVRALLGLPDAAEMAELIAVGRDLVASLMEGRPVARSTRLWIRDVAPCVGWTPRLDADEARAAVRALVAGAVEAPRAALGLVLETLLSRQTDPRRSTGDLDETETAGSLLRRATPVRATVVVAGGELVVGAAGEAIQAGVAVACSFEAVNNLAVEPLERGIAASQRADTEGVRVNQADATFGLGRFVCPGERLARTIVTSFVDSARAALARIGPVEIISVTHAVTPIHRSVETLVIKRRDELVAD